MIKPDSILVMYDSVINNVSTFRSGGLLRFKRQVQNEYKSLSGPSLIQKLQSSAIDMPCAGVSILKLNITRAAS